MVSYEGQHIFPFHVFYIKFCTALVIPYPVLVLCNLIKENKLIISDRYTYSKVKQVFKLGIDPLIHSPIQKCSVILA